MAEVHKSTLTSFFEEWSHSWLSFIDEPMDGEQFGALGGSSLFSGTGIQTLDGLTHPSHRRMEREGVDSGGPFRTAKQIHEHFENCPEFVSSEAGTYRYRGPQRAWKVSFGPNDFPDSIESGSFDLNSFGTTAIARVLPTNPVAGLATFIGEMREGIPSLVGSDFFRSRSLRAKNAGSEYLNVEFGWKPLVSDVQRFGHAVKNSHELLDQYARGSGSKIKRSYKLQFPDEVSVINSEEYPSPLLDGPIYRSGGSMTTTTVKKRKLWFEGCFTYYLAPLTGSWRSKGWLQRASFLSGGRFSPETLWDIAPWSWGADWFGNVGDVLHNVNAFSHDGLVMRYGYVMETTSVKVTHVLTGVSYGNSVGPFSLTQSFETSVKKRVGATPLGFGFNMLTGLTARQGAIIAALGLSRGTR